MSFWITAYLPLFTFTLAPWQPLRYCTCLCARVRLCVWVSDCISRGLPRRCVELWTLQNIHTHTPTHTCFCIFALCDADSQRPKTRLTEQTNPANAFNLNYVRQSPKRTHITFVDNIFCAIVFKSSLVSVRILKLHRSRDTEYIWSKLRSYLLFIFVEKSLRS